MQIVDFVCFTNTVLDKKYNRHLPIGELKSMLYLINKEYKRRTGEFLLNDGEFSYDGGYWLSISNNDKDRTLAQNNFVFDLNINNTLPVFFDPVHNNHDANINVETYKDCSGHKVNLKILGDIYGSWMENTLKERFNKQLDFDERPYGRNFDAAVQAYLNSNGEGEATISNELIEQEIKGLLKDAPEKYDRFLAQKEHEYEKEVGEANSSIDSFISSIDGTRENQAPSKEEGGFFHNLFSKSDDVLKTKNIGD